MTNWTTWLATLLAYLGIGAIIGGLLDLIVWYVSYDYVYTPGQFLKELVKFSFLIGALVACTGTYLHTVPQTRFQWLRSIMTIFLVTVLTSAFTATCLALLAKTGFLSTINKTMIPLTRIYFCQGLQFGAYAGLLISSFWSLWRVKKKTTVRLNND